MYWMEGFLFGFLGYILYAELGTNTRSESQDKRLVVVMESPSVKVRMLLKILMVLMGIVKIPVVLIP